MKSIIVTLLLFATISVAAQDKPSRIAIANESKDTLFVDASVFKVMADIWTNDTPDSVAKPVLVRVTDINGVKTRETFAIEAKSSK